MIAIWTNRHDLKFCCTRLVSCLRRMISTYCTSQSVDGGGVNVHFHTTCCVSLIPFYHVNRSTTAFTVSFIPTMTMKVISRKRRRSAGFSSAGDEELPPTSVEKSEVSEDPRKERVGKSVPLHVHECSFAKPHVAGYSAIATTRSGNIFAISTTDGLVQLYQKSEHWQPVSVIFPDTGSPEMAVSCLKFSPCDRYLFVSRLDGSLSIYYVSAEGLLLHVVLQPGGGAIWDMSFREMYSKVDFHLAIACDDGRVRFVLPDPDYATLDPASPFPDESSHYIINNGEKSSDRILCVSWASSSKNNSYVVCGDSAGRIRWIDVDHGKCWGNARIAPVRQKSVFIWTLLTVENGSIVVCGDSRGLLTLWSTHSRTMLAEISIEGVQGAIWCLSAFRRISGAHFVAIGCANGGVAGLLLEKGASSWNPIRASLLHTHDVRGIALLSDQYFATASIDGQVLVFSSECLLDKSLKVSKLDLLDGALSQPSVQFVQRFNMMVVRGKETLELWHVPLDPEHNPSIRLRMTLRGLGSTLRSFAISNDCQFVAVSSADSFRLYRIWDGEGGRGVLSHSFGKVDPVDIGTANESALGGCVDLAFGVDVLAAISRCRTKLLFYHVKQKELTMSTLHEIECIGKLLCKVACGKRRVAVSDSSGMVYSTEIRVEDALDRKLKWVKVEGCQTHSGNVTCLAVSPSGERVGFAHLTGMMTLVHMKNGGVKVASRYFSMTLNTISFGEKEKGMLAAGLNHAFIVSWKSKKNSKHFSDEKAASLTSYQVQLPGQVWCCGVLGAGHLIVARRHADVVQTYLPDAIPKKKFGS